MSNTSAPAGGPQNRAERLRSVRLLVAGGLATLLLQSLLFCGMNATSLGPIDFWPLSFVCLVPWVLAISAAPGPAGRLYLTSYLLGVAFYVVNMSYIRYITLPGYIALCLYFGLSYLLFAVALRSVHRRLHVPLTWGVPVLWVAGEFARGIGPLAFPFLMLAHGVYRKLPLIQISDLTGAYGVSFVVAMVNGFLADLLLRRLKVFAAAGSAQRDLFGIVMATIATLSVTLLYGIVQLNRRTMSDGPVIAVLQGDYPLSVDPDSPRVSETEKSVTYLEMLKQAATHQPEPELYLLPETPWAMCLNEEFLAEERFPVLPNYYEVLQRRSRMYDEFFHAFADTYQAQVIVGAGSIEFPLTHYPNTLKYNSAFVYTPGSPTTQRYDKVELVMFGEYTPFRYGSLHFLYRWLDGFNPFSAPHDEFSLTPGASFSVFDLASGRSGELRFGIPICFEDLIPSVSRRFAGGGADSPGADFLLSISNDGWFNHGSLVPQHLAVCVFRAVENRVGIARSVNTACSGFVDPDGRIHNVVHNNGRTLGPGIFGYEVSHVRIDSRRSLYTALGDWFGALCAVLGLLALLLSPMTRLWRRIRRSA